MQASYNINSLTFNNGAGLFTLTNTGGTTLTIQGGGITNSENSLETIDISNITLGAAQTWSATAGALTVSSAVDNNGNLLTINAAQATILSGAIIGGGGLTKNGTNTLTLNGASANTYSGLTTVNTGTLTLNKTAGVTSIAGNLTIGDGAGTDTVTVAANNQIADTSAVTINSSGVLGLNALVTETIGSLTMTAGSVTTSTGTLTLGGDVTGNANANSATITGNLNLGGVVRTFTLADGGAADDMAISAIISNGSITKEGAGTLFLNGANTYTGAVLVNAGTLQLGNILGLGTTAGGATVTAGAVLDLNGIAVGAEAVTLNGTGISSGGALINSSGTAASLSGTVALNTDSSVGGSGALTLSGVISGSAIGLTKVGAGNLTFSGASANTYSGLTTVNTGTLTLSRTAGVTSIAGDLTIGDGTGTDTVTLTTNNQIADTSAVTINAGGVLGLGTVSDTIESLTMTAGSVTGSTGSLTLGGNVIGNANTASATISSLLNLGGTTRTFTIADGVVASDMTISGIISNGGLTKAGAGTLTLSGLNTFGGVLTVEAGNLSVATVNNVSTAGTLGNSAGAVVLGGSGTTGTLQYTGADVTSTKGFTMATGGTGVFQTDTATTELTLNSVVDGSGALTKTGAGSVIFSGASANTYSGLTTVNAGTLTLSKTAGVTSIAGDLTIGDGIGTDTVTLTTANQIADTSAVTINTGGVLGLTNVSDTIGTLTMTAGSVTTGTGTLTLGGNVTGNANAASATISGNLALGATRTFTIADGAATVDMSISAIISGATFGVTKEGAGTLVLSSSGNTYTGATAINTGVLNIQNASALGTIAGATTVSNGAALQIQGGITTLAEGLTLDGTGIAADGALRNASGTNTYTGAITLGSAARINSDSGTLTLNVASGNAITATNLDVTFGGAGNVTVPDAIATGTGALTKDGAGILTLSAANSYTGLTDVQVGTLALGANNVLDNASTLKVSGGILSLVANSDTVAGVQLTAGSITGSTGVLTSTTAFDLQAGSASAILGGSTGATKTTGGTVTLSGTNTYTGLTDVQAGTLTLGASTVFANASTIKVSGGILSLGANSDTVAGVQLTAGSITSSTGVLTSTTAFDLQAGSVGAILGGTAGATKTTGGTVTLSGVNTYTGLTDVQVGTLALGAGGVFANTSTLKVSGGTLSMLTFADTVAGVQLTAGSITGSTGVLTSTTAFDLQAGSVGAILGGTAGANKTTPGTVTLSAANSFTGLTTVSAGTLEYGVTAALSSGAVTVSGGTLDIKTFNDSVGAVTLSSGSITGATGILTGTSYALTNSGSVSAVLAGAVNLTKTGAGTATISGNNTYTGVTSVDVGTLRATTSANALGTGAATLDMGGGTLELANDTALTFNRNSTISASSTIKSDVLTPTGAGVTHTLGTLTFSSAQTLTIGAGGNVGNGTAGIAFGNVTIDAGSPTFTVGSGSLLTMAAIDSGSTADRTITFGGAGNTTVSGVIDDATGAGNSTFVTKSGSGTLTLGGANTYTDTTTISAGMLLANNTTGSATGTGAVSVTTTGAILGGSGTITPGAANGISVTGVLAPGASVGTIGNLTLNLGSTSGTVAMITGASFQYDLGVAGVDINTVGTGDLLTLAGAAANNFAFTGNSIDFLGTGGVGYYKIFDTSLNSATTWTGLGGLPGFATNGGLITSGLTVSNLASGLSGSLIMGGTALGGTAGDIYLQVIPEPSAALLAGIGSLLLLRRRRES